MVLLFYISGRQFSLYPDSFTPEFISTSQMKALRTVFPLVTRLLRVAGTAFKYLIACAFFLASLPSFLLLRAHDTRCNLYLYFWSLRESETGRARRYNENKLIAHVKSFSGLTVMNCLTRFAPLIEFVVR